MAYFDENYNSISCSAESDSPIPGDGGKIIFFKGIQLVLVNLLIFLAVDYFPVNFSAVAGMLCGVMFLFKTHKCREVLIVNYLLSGAPSVIFAIIIFIDMFSLDVETSLGGWVWLFTVLFKAGVFIAIIIACVMWIKFQVSMYMDIFEDRDVDSYIKSKENDFYM